MYVLRVVPDVVRARQLALAGSALISTVGGPGCGIAAAGSEDRNAKPGSAGQNGRLAALRLR